MEVPLHEIRRRFPTNRLDPLLEMLCEPRFEALSVLQKTLGAEVYLTGGIIRDSIAGRPPKDFDFVVRFPAAEGNADSSCWVQRFEDFFGVRGEEGRSGQVVIRGPYGRMTLCGTGFGVYKFLPHGSTDEFDIAFPPMELRNFGGSLVQPSSSPQRLLIASIRSSRFWSA